MLRAYEKLANEIVLQTVKDYRNANKKLARGRNNSEAKALKKECLRFFHSDWFGILTELNAEFLISELDEEVNRVS